MLVVLWCTYFFPHLVGISILSKLSQTEQDAAGAYIWALVYYVCVKVFFNVNEGCVSSVVC